MFSGSAVVKYVPHRTKISAFRSVLTSQKNTAKIRRKYVPQNTATYGQDGWPWCSSCPNEPGRSKTGGGRRTRYEVVCVLAHAFGFESADDEYGRANEATLSRLRTQAARAARRALAQANVNAFVSRHGLAFSPPAILEQQAQEKRVLGARLPISEPQRS